VKTALVVAMTLALCVATALVVAQTAPPATPPPASPTPQTQEQQRQDLQKAGMPRTHAMPTTGQMPKPAAFAMLDPAHTGFVTRERASADPWLSQHFESCDGDHDARVSSAEYAKCSSGP
jgi:hypothetical protein